MSRLFSLPLLTKELIEQAQRKRTYVFRTLYGFILYGMALLEYSSTNTANGTAGFENLGRGREFFYQLIAVQAWAIALLLPTITCGALTIEKEKDTLALLLLTKLSPRTIVFEKLLSRVFAMGTFQLLSLPLFGIVYSIGGVELSEVTLGITALFAMTFAVGSVCILASTWFRTTSEAFVMTYLALFCLSCPLSPVLSAAYGPSAQYYAAGMPMSGFQMTPIQSQFVVLVICSFITAGALGLASACLVPRAFVPSWNVILAAFQYADRYFHELNERTTGGIVLVPDRDSLPLFHPISWRETRKKSLGTFRYQFRVLMFLLAPLILLIASMITDYRTGSQSPLRIFPIYFWLVSIVCLTIHATGVISSERIRQTLDVLLATPLTPRELVLEKLAGVRRLIKVLTVPFAVLLIFEGIWAGYIHPSIDRPWEKLSLELAATAAAVLIEMPVMMWLGFQMGLRLRTQMQAVVVTFVLVIVLCAVPPYLARLLAPVVHNNYIAWLSPIYALVEIYQPESAHSASASMVSANRLAITVLASTHFAIYLAMWYFLRANAIRNFARIVGRLEPGKKSATQSSTESTGPVIAEPTAPLSV